MVSLLKYGLFIGGRESQTASEKEEGGPNSIMKAAQIRRLLNTNSSIISKKMRYVKEGY